MQSVRFKVQNKDEYNNSHHNNKLIMIVNFHSPLGLSFVEYCKLLFDDDLLCFSDVLEWSRPSLKTISLLL